MNCCERTVHPLRGMRWQDAAIAGSPWKDLTDCPRRLPARKRGRPMLEFLGTFLAVAGILAGLIAALAALILWLWNEEDADG